MCMSLPIESEQEHLNTEPRLPSIAYRQRAYPSELSRRWDTTPPYLSYGRYNRTSEGKSAEAEKSVSEERRSWHYTH